MAAQQGSGMAKRLPRSVTTPVTGALALVIGLSGSMLFFHLGEGLVKGAHEWLGMLFVIAMLIHVSSNWRSLTQHLRKGMARTGVMTVLLVAGIFLGNGGFSGTGGPDQVFRALGEAPVASLAQLFKVEETVLMKGLANRGIPILDGTQSLNEAAQLAGVDERAAIKRLLGSVGGKR